MATLTYVYTQAGSCVHDCKTNYLGKQARQYRSAYISAVSRDTKCVVPRFTRAYARMKAQAEGKHRPPIGIAAFGFAVVLLFFVLAASFKWLPQGYWRAWSAETFFFDDYAIDSPSRFALAITLSVVNTFVQQLVRQNISPWLNNCLFDHKTPRADLGCESDFLIHITAYLFYSFSALASTLNIFLSLTSVWTLIAQVVTTISITYFTTRRFLRQKQQDCRGEKKDEEELSYVTATATTESRAFANTSPYRVTASASNTRARAAGGSTRSHVNGNHL